MDRARRLSLPHHGESDRAEPRHARDGAEVAEGANREASGVRPRLDLHEHKVREAEGHRRRGDEDAVVAPPARPRIVGLQRLN